MCDLKICLVIHDPLKRRAIQLCSDGNFDLNEAVLAVNCAKQSQEASDYMRFTNEDYDRIDETDFRKINKRGRPPNRDHL